MLKVLNGFRSNELEQIFFQTESVNVHREINSEVLHTTHGTVTYCVCVCVCVFFVFFFWGGVMLYGCVLSQGKLA